MNTISHLRQKTNQWWLPPPRRCNRRPHNVSPVLPSLAILAFLAGEPMTTTAFSILDVLFNILITPLKWKRLLKWLWFWSNFTAPFGDKISHNTYALCAVSRFFWGLPRDHMAPSPRQNRFFASQLPLVSVVQCYHSQMCCRHFFCS